MRAIALAPVPIALVSIAPSGRRRKGTATTMSALFRVSPEEVVDGQLAAYNARDLEKFMEYYVEDVSVHAFPSGEVLADCSGPAFRERYRRLFAGSPDLHAELVSRVRHGRIVVDQERVTGFMGDQVRTAVAMYEVGAERIERVWFVA
ncbi:nuclear transport factor 2 family protein [Streptomyces sp. NPDC049577]|uniref:nuclear transport factor 2 family protein n=1 Tax=Streptomyces sp. NPDC049577 TaxID=3155153 RepID=UPI0034275621